MILIAIAEANGGSLTGFPPWRSVFAGEHDGLVGDIEGERGKREISEGDALGENDIAVAVVTRQAGGTAFGNGELPMLERFGGDL
jgi:hypothetical protein